METIEGVLVVGVGPVGVTIAMGLARAGIPVTLLEAESGIVDSPRAVVHHWATLEYFDQLGLLDLFKKTGFIKQDYQYRAYRTGEIFNFDLSPLEDISDYPFNLHLGQHLLAEIALGELEKLQGPSVRWNNRVVRVEQDSEWVTITAETPDGEKDYRARWVVAADGGRSGVRTSLNLRFDGITWPERFVATNVWYDFEKYGFARSTMYLDPVHWMVTAKIDETNLWRLTYGEDAALPEEGVMDRLPEHYAALLPGDQDYKIDRVSPYRMHQRVIENLFAGRVIFAGDSGHVTNPVGGLGLTTGLYDSFTLAPTLAAVLHGEANEFALADWARLRRNSFMEVTSPMATANKKRLAESDPEKQEVAFEHFRRMGRDRDYCREALQFVKKLETPVPVARKLGAPA